MKQLTCIFLYFMMLAQPLHSQNVGIGTVSPTDKLHINGVAGSNPLLVQINSVNKLRVNSNGGTSIGSAVTPPANGLYVGGSMNPAGGIRSTTNPISIQSSNDSVEIMAGNNRIVISANGGIRIITSNGSNGITIDAGTGDLNLKGNNVNITATNNCTTKANKLFTTSTDSTYFSTINGDIALYSARNTDITSALNLSVTSGANAVINTGAAMAVTTGANLNFTTGGATDINSSGSLAISTSNTMNLSVNNSYTLQTGGAININPGTTYDLNGIGNVTIRSFSTSRLNGALVLLNNGTKPAARVSDPTQTLYTNGVGTITAGSATVLIGN